VECVQAISNIVGETQQEQIEETKRKKKASSDGLPALGGQSKGGESNKTLVRGGRNGVGSDIWGAANMKRNNYE
jgi:hypothetical protein